MDPRALRDCRRGRPRLLAAVALALLALAPSTGAQTSPASPASPSAPPFWARPKPNATSCACDEKVQAFEPQTSSSSGLLTGAVGGAGLILLMLLARRMLRKQEQEDEPRPRAVPAPAPAPAPAEPPSGLDPRARLAAARAAARPAPAPAVAPAPEPPKEEFKYEDPRTAQIELAQDEPAAESDRATSFYSEVAFSLLDALRKEPGRQDLRFKLLEIYYARKQVDEFVTLAHEYLNTNRGLRDEPWALIMTMGTRIAPKHALFAGADGEEVPRPMRRLHQMRRFHERDVEQGKVYTAQQALGSEFQQVLKDSTFQTALRQLLADAARRPSPLAASPELSYVSDGARIFIKHEDRRRFHDDLLINVFGQMLMAQRLGRSRVVTATRDGILGHTVASAAARLGLECMVYITEPDLTKYYARVLSMRRLGAILRPIPGGAEQEPPDPRRAALEAWLNDPGATQYISGLSGGPTPYPEMVREFLSVVGRETAEQMSETAGGLPTAVVTSTSDGYLGLGLLQGLLNHDVKLYCVEEHMPTAPKDAKPDPAHPPLSALPSRLLTRREHHWLRESRRVEYIEGEDQETLRIVEQYHATGTTLYTDSARTLAQARVLARRLQPKDSVVVLLTSQEGADFRSSGNDW